VSYGCDPVFNKICLDPMYSFDIKDYNGRMKKLRRAVQSKKSLIREALPISAGVKEQFYSAQRAEQKRILTILEFEFKMFSLKFKKCDICKTTSLRHVIDDGKSTICTKCKNLKLKSKQDKTQYYIEKNMLPVWYDSTGKIHYELPDELLGLTHGEKMLLQRIAVLCPVVHIYQGSTGIKGHTCCF
jgi:hypothetical protein